MTRGVIMRNKFLGLLFRVIILILALFLHTICQRLNHIIYDFIHIFLCILFTSFWTTVQHKGIAARAQLEVNNQLTEKYTKLDMSFFKQTKG